MSDAIDAGRPDEIPACLECDGALKIELWVLEPRDVALLHVCSHHGAVAISRPTRLRSGWGVDARDAGLPTSWPRRGPRRAANPELADKLDHITAEPAFVRLGCPGS